MTLVVISTMQPWRGEEIAGKRLPPNLESIASAEYLQELGLARAKSFDAPKGKIVEGEPTYADDGAGGVNEIFAARWPTWQEARSRRDALLAESDWTMLTDAKISVTSLAAWTKYRQYLRDIPQTYATTDLIVWPAAPTYSKA